ncbi:hypothetical protein BMR07_13990, partial [Methylococcaceae bacterium CS1]
YREVVSCLFLKIVLTKVGQIQGMNAAKVIGQIIGFVTIISVIALVGSMGYKFYELYLQGDKKIILDRLIAESSLQAQRGNIERCVAKSNLKKLLYMDFEFSQHDKGLNIDIRPSRDSCMDGYFELSHYRVPYFQNGSDRLGYKLSETNPDLNGCIVGSDSFAKYKLEKGNALRHTFALDKWVEIKKLKFPNY